MHLEIQVALNFVISYLYNKLPRRRVNIFGEELEKALRLKFEGHWYPEKPFKGSAFRCIKTGNPMDIVFERAAKESGMDLQDIRENLPEDLAIWVDPGEVSYRIGEKSSVRILFSEKSELSDESLDREVTKTFNPEAQTFLPIDCVSNSFGNLTISPSQSVSALIQSSKTPSPVPFLPPKNCAPLTFTTASFAQTKFGSTKLKSNTKRPNRMSPTEFSHYIKQRAMLQQLGASYGGLQRPRSLSPVTPLPADPVMHPFHSPYSNPCYISDLVNCAPSPSHHGKFNGSYMEPMFGSPDCTTPSASPGTPPSGKYPDNLGMGTVSYATNQYHHLLVAN